MPRSTKTFNEIFFQSLALRAKLLNLRLVRVRSILNKFHAALVTEKERPIMLIKTLCEGYGSF